MGVDIQTYRARIGNYKHSRCDETVENYRQPSGCNVAVTDINVSNRLKTVGCVLFICVLLIIAGIEQNPGPVEKGSESCQSDEAAEWAKGADMRTDDSAPKLHHAEPTRIQISGLMENMNKEMLEMFFDKEERDGGGKVKNIDLDSKSKCAIVEFEDKTGVDLIMKKTPMAIFGLPVRIEVTGGDTKKTKMIKISKLPATLNKEMLLMFFKNMMESDENVVDVTVNAEDSHVIVEFDNSAAVQRVLDQKPLKIFGFEVDVDTFVPDIPPVFEPLDIPRIRISGLMENTNKEMLTMYFELQCRNGEGKVKNIDIDKKRKFAIIEFEEKAGAEAFLLRNPKSILGMDVMVEVIDTTSDKSHTKSKRIKISGLAENTNKEMLEMFFETEERKGGGKVNNIFIDGNNRCARIEFEDETGVEWIMNKTPISIFGVEVGIETLDYIDEPKKIQITNLPVSINKEMLRMFFDNKIDFGGKVIDISIKSEENMAIVEFGDSTAVYRIMENRSLTILGFNVDVDVFDTSHVVESLDIPRIGIFGLQEDTNNEMLAMYFQHEERKGGGKVKNIEINQKGKFATIDFEEKAGADAFLLRNPKSILGMNVTVKAIDITSDKSRTKSTRIKITGLAENVNKEMLEMFFKTEERKGGGKVNNIFIEVKNRCVLIEFEDETGADRILNKTPTLILGKEVEIERIDDIDQHKKIQITKLPVCMTEDMLKMFFEDKTEFGGKVIDISITSEENKAIVEFDNSTAVYRILDVLPLTILGFNVDVDIFVSDTSTVVEPHDIQRMKISGQMENTNKEMAAMYYEHGEGNSGRIMKHNEMDQMERFPMTDFEEEAGDKVTLQTEHTESGIQRAAPLQTTETESTRFGEKEHGYSQEYESAVANNADSNPFESDLERPDSSKSGASTETGGQIFYQILNRLGLTDKYPGRISLRDIIAVDPNESIEKVNGKISLTDIPWLVLKRLMCAHSESRDITVSEEEHSANSLEDSLTFFSEIPDVNQDISPLDIFTVVFQCCDPVMKQIFVQKLYLCKLAVPFLYRYWETNEKQTPILSVWPLRSLAIESKEITATINKVQGRESDVLDLETKVLAFGRLGRPRYSKSKLINSLLLSQDCKTFFNIDCPSGMTPRKLSNGQVELFWLPTIDEKKDRFQDAMTFLNLRGDLVQDFSKDILLFISHFIDSIVIIIDLDKILKDAKMVKDVLLQFSSVSLIIANPLNHNAVKQVQCFQSEVISSKSEFSLRILSTHKGAVEQNVVDMLSSITKITSTTLETNNTMSFEKRLLGAKLTTIKTDEEEEVCQKGKLNATELMKQMKAVGEPSSWKQHLTPVHSSFSKDLGKLFKKRERQRDLSEVFKIDEEINTVRRNQISSITQPVRFFLDILIKSNSCPLVLRYFLCWLQFYIEREKRQILPQLMHENRSAWEKLKALKAAEKLVKEDIEKQETVIKGLEEKIDKASFAVQHFFREIGHIHEAILELKEDTNELGFPNINLSSSIIGRLVADGHPFELIDGESFYMPYLWTQTVLKMVDECIGSSKVMTLGVLGLQSSGKSTLLNTMFGSQFSSRTGRCTRGIHVQLVPAHIGTTSSVFSYVLIVDTEGLRSPELSNVQHEHDNELATVITGVGDITMLNIMGENTSEIRDILQVIVHAFLRLKMTNEQLDIRKSCAFIHQNVTDMSASENMISGLSKLMQTLDEMTKESAESEGIHDIKTFNQVIEFDITSQVWYLKNLWQGNPPMARVNNEYSESVVDIKSKIVKKALTMENKSYKSLNDIVEQAHSLWKGVLNEDFVFSFRNSLEIKAYMQMECRVAAELWRFEGDVQDKLIQMSQSRFAICDQKENLQSVANKIISEMGRFLSDERTKTEEIIQRYFDKNTYKDIIIQWKNNQHVRVTFLRDKLQQVIKQHVDKCQEKRFLQILTVKCHGKHEDELWKKSIDVANAHKGQKLSSEEIDKLFDDIWKEFLIKVDTSSTSLEKHTMKMQDIFMTCLENIFKQKHALLKKVLNDTNSLAPLSEAKPLTKSFCETGINKTDVGCTWYQKGKMFFGRADSDSMKHVEDKVFKIFESVDRKITELCQVNDEVTEMSVGKLMHELGSITESMLTGDSKYTFKATFYVKLYVHISRYAHTIFDNHNEKYFKTHGTAILLEQYRVQQKISFVSHLRCREIEELIAELLSNVIESFAEEWTSQNLPNKVADKLQTFLPKVKNIVIIELCTDLLEKGNFENFNRYIVDPYGYASSWITIEANSYLDDSKFQVIANTSMSLLDLLFSSITRCVKEIHNEYEKEPPSIDTWIESFQKKLETADVSIPSESFRNVRHEQSSKIQNVGHLTNTLLEYLNNSEKKLASKFKSQKSNTIKWAGFNPISRLIEKIWGCKEKCVFCGEPCAKDQNHEGSKHYSIQHRPSCCMGTYKSSTNLASLESCSFKVQSDKTHGCSVLNYVCSNGNYEGCGKTHYYKDFKTYFPDWDIPPSSNMHESSEYWMWFVATYKDQLKEYYDYQIDHIPSSWSTITKSAAKESLHKVYSAC